MKKNRPSESAQDHSNEIKVDNDGNKWILLPNSQGIYTWRRYSESYILDSYKKFQLTINSSVIVPKKGETISCVLDKNGLKLDVSSKYFSYFDGKKIFVPFKKLVSDCFDNTCTVGYIGKDIILVKFELDKRNNNDDLFELIDKMKKYDYADVGYIPKIEHMYGTLELLTVDKLKKLKKGENYYLVVGQQWDSDFTGADSINVLEYEGYEYEGQGKNSYSSIMLMGNLYSRYEGKLYNWGANIIDSQGCLENSCTMVTGTGADPVYLITRFRKGFVAPSFLPKASTF